MNSHNDPTQSALSALQAEFCSLLVSKYQEIDVFFNNRGISKPSFIKDLPFYVKNSSSINSVQNHENPVQNIEIPKKNTPRLEFLRELDTLSDNIERNLKEYQRNRTELDKHEDFDEDYKSKVRETIDKIQRNVGFLVQDNREKDRELNKFLEEMEEKCMGLEQTKEKLAEKVKDQTKINELQEIIKKMENELKLKDQELIDWKSKHETLMAENNKKLEKKTQKKINLMNELIPLRQQCMMLETALKTKEQEILKLKEEQEVWIEDLENKTLEKEKKLKEELDEEKGKKEDLVRENMDKADEIYNLMAEINDLKGKADAEKDGRRRVEVEKEKLEDGMKQLYAELDISKNRIEGLEGDLRFKTREIVDLIENSKSRIEGLEEDLRFKTREIVDLTQEISEKKRDLNDLQNENTENAKEVDSKLNELQEIIQKLQREKEELLTERSELTEKTVTFNNESMKMQEERLKLEEEFTFQMRKLVEEKAQLEKDLEIKHQSVEELQKHHDKALEEKDLEIANLQFKINDLKKQELAEEEFKIQMRKLVEEKENLEKELEIKHQSVDGLQKNHDQTIDDLKKQELKLQEDIAFNKNEANRLSKELIKKTDELEKSNISNHILSEEAKRTCHELDQVKNELRNMEQALEDYKLQHNKVQQDGNTLEILVKETEQIKNELGNMEQLLESTKLQLEKTQKDGEALQNQIQQNEQLITSLRETVSEKDEQILKEKDLLEQIKNELIKMEQLLEDTKSQLEKTEKDGEDLQNKIKENELHITSLQETLSEKNEILLKQKEEIDTKVLEHLELKKKEEISVSRFKGTKSPDSNQYDLVLHIDSLTSKEGWNLIQSPQFNMEALLEYEFSRVGFVGRENSGKTFLLNQLSRLNLPSQNINTQGLSLVATKHFIGIDSVGLQVPVYFYDEKTLKRLEMTGEQVSQSTDIRYRMLNERTMTDLFVQDYVLETCHIIVVMVGKLTQNDQKLIERISKKYQARKRIFVVHNYSDLMDVADIEKRVAIDILQAFNVKQIKENQDVNVPVFVEEHEETKNFEGPQKDDIVHLVLGFEGMESGNHYNPGTLDFLAKAIETHPEKEKFDLRANLSQFFEENHRNYLHFKSLPKSPAILDLVAEGKKMQIVSENEFDVMNPLFNSLGTPMPPHFEVIEEKERYICSIEMPDLLMQENLCLEIKSRKGDDFGVLMVKGLKKKDGIVFCDVPLGPKMGIEKVNMESLVYKDGVLVVEVVRKAENEGNL